MCVVLQVYGCVRELVYSEALIRTCALVHTVSHGIMLDTMRPLFSDTLGTTEMS